jgi:hypothetical protein
MTQSDRSDIEPAGEVVDGELVPPPDVRPTAIDALGALLQRHQASISIDYLYDHGWQVDLGSPGGHLYVHACEYPNKWPEDGGPSLVDTIAKAIQQAIDEGWW